MAWKALLSTTVKEMRIFLNSTQPGSEGVKYPPCRISPRPVFCPFPCALTAVNRPGPPSAAAPARLPARAGVSSSALEMQWLCTHALWWFISVRGVRRRCFPVVVLSCQQRKPFVNPSRLSGCRAAGLPSSRAAGAAGRPISLNPKA